VLPCAMLEAAALLAPAKLRASRMVRRRARFARYWAFCARLALCAAHRVVVLMIDSPSDARP
jgi:hypothetical protein